MRELQTLRRARLDAFYRAVREAGEKIYLLGEAMARVANVWHEFEDRTKVKR